MNTTEQNLVQGAWYRPESTRFCIWAPQRKCVELLYEPVGGTWQTMVLSKTPTGHHVGEISHLPAGSRYWYRVDGDGPFPDPASHFQPEGVHHPSVVVDHRFEWTDHDWQGVSPEDAVIYELHTGTFSPKGTFQAIVEHLDYLQSLHINVVELMPVGDFPGDRGWGYDGVKLYAPARCYGSPNELKSLINAAHQRGIAVILDVVYNHLGPDGNYTGVFSDRYFTRRHQNPWGDSLNFDDPAALPVRQFFLDNVRFWLEVYHVDGFRLDATHAIIDDTQPHLLAEIARITHECQPKRARIVIAEDPRNDRRLVLPASEGGDGLDSIWTDDFHHQVRRLLAGDHEGYYADFTGTLPDLVKTIRDGWFYQGQFAPSYEENRGTTPVGLPHHSFVYCIQNHDQVGNRAFGERLHHEIDLPAYAAATALLLCCPQVPMLFQGQEWAASTPFLYFTAHHDELGHQVTAGRRREFGAFTAFRDPEKRETIPDPQAESTFLASKLQWDETRSMPHAGMLKLYQDLLQFRSTEIAPRGTERFIELIDQCVVLLISGKTSQYLALFHLDRSIPHCQATIPKSLFHQKFAEFAMQWSTESPNYLMSPQPPEWHQDDTHLTVRFQRPGAIVLRCKAE
ncbi:MAG: malto-oligosyltrehalose trehalohydrolase [Zavarzinella sp.]